MYERLAAHWVYGGFLASFLLIALVPTLLAPAWSIDLLAVYLLLPIYMLHQYEEHERDRFRRYFNDTVGRGQDALTAKAVFLINVPGVWGLMVVSILLTRFVSPGFGLIAVYSTLLNALVHIGAAIAGRAYNPGLWTAVVLFLPASVFALVEVARTGDATWPAHAFGLCVGVAIHAAIFGFAHARAARMTGS